MRLRCGFCPGVGHLVDLVCSLWDGLLSSDDRILVLGATNRPNDIDSAILRRMPKRFSVSLPNFDQRLKILSLVSPLTPPCPAPLTYSPQILKDTKLDRDFPLVELAERTDGYSGSDLKELCRNAAMVPMRELMRQAGVDRAEMARICEQVRVSVAVCPRFFVLMLP